MQSTKPKNQLAYIATVVDAAEAVDGKQTEYTIEGVPGLRLVCHPSGSASWTFRYQIGAGSDRKRRREKIGPRGVVTLADAKKRAMELNHQIVVLGKDPHEERENEAAAKRDRAKAVTFGELFDARMKADDTLSANTQENYRLVMDKYVLGPLGARIAREITPEDIADVLEVVERVSKQQAHKVRSAIGSTYRWAVQRRRAGIRVNPTAGLGFTYTAPPRKVTLEDDQLRAMWADLEAGTSVPNEAHSIIIRLAMLTGQRNTTVAGALVSELKDLDGDWPHWQIAGEHTDNGKRVEGRMKSNREHTLPLPAEAVALFKRALEISAGGRQVFPADMARIKAGTKPKTPHVGRSAIATAMRALCSGTGANVRVHDMRKVMTTWMAEQNVPKAVRQRILDHAAADITDSHYDMSTLKGQVRSAMERWASHVTGQEEKSNSNVVAFAR